MWPRMAFFPRREQTAALGQLLSSALQATYQEDNAQESHKSLRTRVDENWLENFNQRESEREASFGARRASRSVELSWMEGQSVLTSLAIVVPEHLTSWIQQIRGKHDKAFKRWPPHIKYVFGSVCLGLKSFPSFFPIGVDCIDCCVLQNSSITCTDMILSLIHQSLLFPFIPEEEFARELPRLSEAVGHLPKFRLKLHTPSFFKHGPRRFVLVLKPEESVRLFTL